MIHHMLLAVIPIFGDQAPLVSPILALKHLCLCANSKLYNQHEAVPCFNLKIQHLVSSGSFQKWPAGGAEFQETLAKLHTCI